MRIILVVLITTITACGPSSSGEFTCPDLPGWTFDREQTEYSCGLALTVRNIGQSQFKAAQSAPMVELPVYVTRFVSVSEDHNAAYHPVDGITLSCDGRGYVHGMVHQFYFETKGRLDEDGRHVGFDAWAFSVTEKFERSIIVPLPCE